MNDTSSISPRRDGVARGFLPPRRILWKSGGRSEVHDSALLLHPVTTQPTVAAARGCLMESHADPAGLLLDFGRELAGGVRIVLRYAAIGDASGPVRIRVRFGESASEAMAEDALNDDHAVMDALLDAPRIAGTVEFGSTGFRFVRLELPQEGARAEILSVEAVLACRDLAWRGSFRSSDERLDGIWETGAYTVQLNLQDCVWDGVKRDRLVWMGDLHGETLVTLSVFGAQDVVPRSLDLVRDQTPLPGWMNGISSYSLWWIILQRDWHLYTADRGYLSAQRPYLLGLVRQLSGCIDALGGESLPETRFLDWPSSRNPATIHAGLHALMLMALTAARDVSRFLDDASLERASRDALARVSRTAPSVDPRAKQAAALIALSGLEPPASVNARSLAVDPFKGVSTYYGLYILEARAAAGDWQGCLDLIRRYWGAMLDLGATTFWEDFDLSWAVDASRVDELPVAGKLDIHRERGDYCYKGYRHSLCHGWAGGPTAWLSRHVLGIMPTRPGFQSVRVTPHLGDLSWAEGCFPTPRGDVRVRHVRRPDGTVGTELECPAGITVEKE